jgi:hypothetical protein
MAMDRNGAPRLTLWASEPKLKSVLAGLGVRRNGCWTEPRPLAERISPTLEIHEVHNRIRCLKP